MEENKFYQIHLYSKGKIEIFQNVFWHKIYIEGGEQQEITIKYSSSKNEGSCCVSTRLLWDVYDIKIIDEPEFIPQSERPLDKHIIIYGSGKTIEYLPENS